KPSRGAVHEGHSAVPDVRLFQSHGRSAQGRRRDRHPHGERAGRPGSPRQPAALFQLADVPAAVHPRRADRRLRHHAGTARERRAGADDRGSPEGVSGGATTTPGRALEGRAILVTGAHGGLGRAVALACAQAGATAVLLGRKSRRLEQVADAIEKAGGHALLHPLDLEGAVPDDYAELAVRLGERPGRLDGVVHCAAEFAGLTPLEHTDPGAFARALHVDLTARWWLSQACLPLLRASDAATL